MSAKEFICSWRITNYNFSCLFNFKSPAFKVENLGEGDWCLHLWAKTKVEGLIWKTEKKYLVCQLSVKEYKSFLQNGKTILNFWYELTDIDGDFLRRSEKFSHVLQHELLSDPYELIDLEELMKEMSNCTDDTLILRCYMVSNLESCSVLPINCCEIETTPHLHVVPFEWYFKFPSTENWTVAKKVCLTNLTFVITFKYVIDQIEIELLSDIKDNREHLFVCELAICNSIGGKIASEEHFEILHENNKTWCFPSFISKEHLELAECFTLEKIRFKLRLMYPYSSTIRYSKDSKKNTEFKNIEEGKCLQVFANREKFAASEDNLSDFRQDIFKMLLEKEFSDIQLRVDNEIFPAHKLVLAARSSVFFGIFKQDEASTIVDISNADKNTVNTFLEYIYTGKIRDMNEEIALNLLILADKYQVLQLVEKCSMFLKSIMSLTNVCKILSIADKGNYEYLKSISVEYIVDNSIELLSSPGWLQLLKMNETLASFILLKVSNKFAWNGKEESLPGSSKDLQDPTSGANSRKSQSGAESLKDGLKENKESEKSSSLVVEPEGRQMKTL